MIIYHLRRQGNQQDQGDIPIYFSCINWNFYSEAVAVPVEECVEYCTNFDSLPFKYFVLIILFY